jgi:hemerythrin superfamily protein
MDDAAQDAVKAAQLPEGDVIRVLLEQHARIRELFTDLKAAMGGHKRQAFDELRALLAVHETAEEMVLRPISKGAAGEAVVTARNKEEEEATKVLKDLERMDITSNLFGRKIAILETMVLQHAENEENEEFPHVLAQCDAEMRQSMGKALKGAESIAPTHAHPSTAGESAAAHMVIGPFMSLVDRARDALSRSGR